MNIIRAVIIDDESKSLKNLQIILENYCPNVRVEGTASSALEAVGLIMRVQPDVIFLDIEMPGHSGFDVMEQVRSLPSRIIFTTAHREYAIQAIKNDAFDYLLKPVDPSELQQCIARVDASVGPSAQNTTAPLQLNVKEGVIFIDPSEIVKLQASGSYTDIYFDDGTKITTSKVLKEYERMLSSAMFYRCHNSYIVNLSKIKKLLNIDGYYVEFRDGSRAEVAKKNREELLGRMKVSGLK